MRDIKEREKQTGRQADTNTESERQGKRDK